MHAISLAFSQDCPQEDPLNYVADLERRQDAPIKPWHRPFWRILEPADCIDKRVCQSDESRKLLRDIRLIPIIGQKNYFGCQDGGFDL
jgi:hypothetical protein